MITHTVADRLDELVDETTRRLQPIDDTVVAARPGEGKWSIKEIIGHLLDSAVNNHHRFIRARDLDDFTFPGYEQDLWVGRQNYQDASWPALLELWRLYNHHLAHVMRHIPEDALYNVCRIGSYEPCTLRFLVEDYLDHMEHHLKAVESQSYA
jgi:hypothetical protein